MSEIKVKLKKKQNKQSKSQEKCVINNNYVRKPLHSSFNMIAP